LFSKHVVEGSHMPTFDSAKVIPCRLEKPDKRRNTHISASECLHAGNSRSRNPCSRRDIALRKARFSTSVSKHFTDVS
jgi:hypothetical protein